MAESWHTEGYLKLASALTYLVIDRAAYGASQDIKAEIEVLRDCGKLIRQENE